MSGYGTQGSADADIKYLKGEDYNPDGQGGYKLGAGLEIIKVGDLNIIAPKGSRIRRHGSQIILEDPAEYLGRKFDDINKRFSVLENNQQDIQAQLQKITQFLDELSRREAGSKK